MVLDARLIRRRLVAQLAGKLASLLIVTIPSAILTLEDGKPGEDRY